jgi:hypothetical protein
MKSGGIVRLAVASALALSAATAYAASDYLLEIKGVQGESGASDASQTIELSSWSWGASNPTSVGSSGMSAGKVSMQDMSVMATQPATAQAVRESPTKASTGKTAAQADAAAGTPAGAAAGPPKVGDMATVTVRYRESPTKASTGKTSQAACTAGEHYKEVVLTGQGRQYVMQDVVVTACAAANGERRKELTGHVTLIK